MSERRRILVVDDEPLNRELLRRFLHRDFEVIEAEGVDHALSELEAGQVALIICDQLMPGRYGTDLAEEVRRRWPGTLMVLLTGYEGADEVQSALDDGLVCEIICKPWRGAQLREMVERLLPPPE
jgi:two-component system response regulator HupR/HoxA